MRRFMVMVALAGVVGACAIIPGNWRAHQNQKGPGTPTKANFEVGEQERRDGRFIGIAVSGGGSRAANFATAVLLELRTLGVLDRADFLSSVSGGSLAAGLLAVEGYEYFTLTGTHKIAFTEEEVKDRLGRDLQMRYTGRWFLPWNILRYWLTNFTRTDIMFDTLDANLFHGATYADLNPAGPKLLINATEMGEPQRFVFTDESFTRLESNLAPYRMSAAVTASAAVPGLFHQVLLQNYSGSAPSYVHLSDAAVTDNLGLETLLDVLRTSLQQKTYSFPKGCVLISIDATPMFFNSIAHKMETRQFPEDYLIDRNASEAVDFILLSKRQDMLARVGMTEGKRDQDPLSEFSLQESSRERCRFWHIALRQIPPSDDFGQALTQIPTEFNITQDPQKALFRAAHELVRKGWGEKGASSWFAK